MSLRGKDGPNLLKLYYFSSKQFKVEKKELKDEI